MINYKTLSIKGGFCFKSFEYKTSANLPGVNSLVQFVLSIISIKFQNVEISADCLKQQLYLDFCVQNH